MKVLRQFVFGILAIAFMASSAVMSFAGDPPSRVARLNYMSGQVSMQPGGVNDWAAATINRPMTTADRLWTDKDSRAELQLGSAAMRMDSNTSLTLSNLNDSTVQLELDQGTLNLNVARLWNGQIYEVDTPNMAFTIQKPGSYRFDVDSRDDTTLATVWRGKGIATGNGQAVKIDSRKQVRFEGGMSLEHASFKAPHFDGFDEWCQTREDREAHSVSVRYVSPDVIGYQDLDQYGYWRAVPVYGNAWFPSNVVAGWAPYRFGHWVWVDPWGWSWVDDAAWGFAPFHYGRWVTVAGAWAWVPGPIAVRPYYAPALVAWVGSGGAGVGWFPLGYGEPYIPSYHVSRTYFETVNVSNTRITNITYVTNNYYNNSVHVNNIHYVNQTTAVTIVNNDVLVNSRRVDPDSWIDHDRDRRADHEYRVMAGGPSVSPSHESVLGGDRGRSTVEPPERVFGRHVVTNVKPPERPVAFETRHPDADGHREHPLNNGEDDRMGNQMPVEPRPDQNARNGNWQGRSDRPDQQRSSDDDRDRHNPVADQRGNFSANVPHPPRRRDDDRNNQNSGGGYQSAEQHPEREGHGNDGEHRSGDAGMPQPNNPNSDRGQQSDSSAEGRFPHPPRRGDDNGQQQASSAGSQQAPKHGDQNQNGNNGERRYGSPGMPGNQNGNSGQQSDASGDGRFPHPPQRGNDNGQQASSGGNQPAPKQADQNPNGNNGERRYGSPGMPGNQTGNSEQAVSNGGNQPAPKQAVQNPRGSDGQQQRANPVGNDRSASNGQGLQGNNSSLGRPVPRPPYAGGGSPVSQPVTIPSSAARNVNASASSSPQVPPQSSNSGRNLGSPAQAVNRPMQRPAQAQNSSPQPRQPTSHVAQAQPAPHPQNHPAAPSNAAANASAHGNSFQAHPITPQEH